MSLLEQVGWPITLGVNAETRNLSATEGAVARGNI